VCLPTSLNRLSPGQAQGRKEKRAALQPVDIPDCRESPKTIEDIRPNTIQEDARMPPEEIRSSAESPAKPLDDGRLVDDVVAALGSRKDEFTRDVQDAVAKFIAGQGGNCLAIVGRSPSGAIARTWPPLPTMEYARCLYAFCRGQHYADLALDSGLTDPVVEVVTERFQEFYIDQSDEIAE
jgi:hypothetical protein